MSEDLPRANVKRIVKAKMLEVAASRYGDAKSSRDLPIHKDALLAFSESAKIFIHYLSATANDICRESKRQTINAEDVLRAVEEIEFVEFIEPLRSALEDYRRENESKKAEKKGTTRKRKSDSSKNVEESHEDENGEHSHAEGLANRDDQEEGSNVDDDDE